MQKIHTSYLCHMKDYEVNITFHQKTWHRACLVLLLALAFKKAAAKTYFLH